MKQIPLVVALFLSACGGSSGTRPDAPARLPDVEAILRAEEDKNVAAIARYATSSDAGQRARAARAYGRILRPECIDPLLVLLLDKDAGVRREAAFAAGQHAWQEDFAKGREKELLKALDPLLADTEPAVRIAAVEAAGKLAMAEAPAVLAPHLKDKGVRAEALMGLYRARLARRLRGAKPADIENLPKDVLDAVVALAGDEDDAVRRNVAYFFWRTKDERGLEAVIKLAGDKHVWTRLAAIGGLGRQGDPKVLPLVLKATEDPEYMVRLTAVQSLAMLKATDKIPAKLAEDPSFHVRAAVADAASDEKLLDRLAKDGSVTVRAAVVKRRKSVEAVRQALADKNWIIREAALDAAAGIEKDAEAIATGALKDADERVVAKAVEVIAGVGSATAYGLLKDALQSPALLVRSTAVEGLTKRKEPDVLAVAWSTYEACMDRKWVEVRETIVDVFAASPGPESDRWLRQIAKDPVPSVSRKARRQLADRGVGDLPAEAKEERAENPYWGLRFKSNPVVVLETTHGAMEIECLADEAPIHVANFVGLVRAKKYDGLLWHRVVPAFVIQGGDPYGTGMGDAGWPIRAEINPARYERGALGMPRSFGFDTGGCQLFFTHLPTPHLDGQYTVFGRVVKGFEVIDLIERGDLIQSATVRE